MSLAQVQNFAISLDGFGTGEGLSREEPFGHAGERLHEWMFATRWWREHSGQAGGSSGDAGTPSQERPSTLSKQEEQTALPESGQVNNHSVPGTTPGLKQ